MLGKVLGAYRIDEEIGTGGMGTVYLATIEAERASAEVGERVAIKVVHGHLLSQPGFFKRFMREAEIGQQVFHENVVRTLDVDALELDGKAAHYLVMEYVEGRTLRDLLKELGTVPEALLREIARQVASGLDAIHAAGVVHRDLKPENVLISEDHRVRIMDLGVAKLVEEAVSLTRKGYFAGSLGYAAPEQFGEGRITPVADLYSLGVLLYELVTGENPFSRDRAVQVMSAHLKDDVPRATEMNSEISPFLSELLATLLEKDPEARFDSAAELHDALVEGEDSPWWAGRERALIEHRAGFPVIPVRKETIVHGREGELAALNDAWGRAREGSGRVVLLEGEAGIGKTRLIDAFLDGFSDRGAHVLYGSYPPSGGIGALSQAILTHLGTAGLEDALRPYLSVTPRLVPAFAALVKHESPPPDSEPIRGDSLHAVFCHLLRGLSDEKPVLWIVDDLHFCNPDSRKIVLSLARAAVEHPVLLVVTSRIGIPEDEVVHYTRIDGFQRLRLARLSPREVVELLREAFRSEALADKLGAQIAYKSDGVPFFVFEMIRGLREGQFIERSPDGTYVATRVIERIEVPSAVRDLVAARLADLTPEERAVLDVGAVQGFEFRADLIAKVRGMQRLVVLELLAGVERRSGVIRSGANGYRFDHHQIQEVLYEEIPAELRAEYHAALADAIEDEAGRSSEDLPGESAVRLASHFLRGSRPAGALPYLDRAIGHLEQAYRNEAAVELSGRCLDEPGLVEGPARAELILRRAERLHLLGRMEEERRELEGALGLADAAKDAGLRARVLTRLGVCLYSTTDFERAEALLREAVELAGSAGERSLLGQAVLCLGNALWSREQFDAARSQYETALSINRETGDRSREAESIGGLGNVLTALGRQEEAGEKYREGLEIAQAAGDRRLAGWLTGNLGSVHWQLGRYDDAEHAYERSLEVAREIGDRNMEATATGNLGRVHHQVGRLAAAREQFERRIAMARESGAARGEAITLVNLGSQGAFLGDLESAEGMLARARASLEEMGARQMVAFAVYAQADLADIRGDRETALELFEEIVASRRSLNDEPGTASALTALGGRLLDGDREAEGRALLSEALEIAGRHHVPVVSVLASAHLARLGEEGAADLALLEFERHRRRLGAHVEMEANWLLHRATGDPARILHAHRLLEHLRAHAPEEYRETMVERVPLHRAIAEAYAALDS